MGRGKQWTDIETKALIEAYIHISEDSVIGTNQSGDQLFVRVMQESKKRYHGDWIRSPDACKKRWQDVSREVQKFCSAMKFVESVERSGWNDDDYFRAAEDYYATKNNSPGSKFKFVEEWRFLKGYEKWKTATSSNIKRQKDQLSSSDSSDSEGIATPRPMGNKKAKATAALESKAEQWIEKITNNTTAQENSKAMLRMMEENIEQSKQNRLFLKEIFDKQTDKLGAKLEKTAALKALTKMDLTTMPAEFQDLAKKKIANEIRSILNF